MPVEYIKLTRKKYSKLNYTPYQWAENKDTVPLQPLKKPLSECRVGLVASGGIYMAGQVAFHHKDDTSFRAIPRDVNISELRATHFAYNVEEARRDLNIVFPIDALRRMVSNNIIKELADHAYTFMGGIYSYRRVNEELAPQLSERLQAENVDIVLFVPV